MAKKTRKSKHPGPKRLSGKWRDVAWIQQRADWYRDSGQVYGVLERAIAARFARIYPPSRQTAENLAKFAKRIKNAKGEWRAITQMRKAARDAERKAKADAAD